MASADTAIGAAWATPVAPGGCLVVAAAVALADTAIGAAAFDATVDCAGRAVGCRALCAAAASCEASLQGQVSVAATGTACGGSMSSWAGASWPGCAGLLSCKLAAAWLAGLQSACFAALRAFCRLRFCGDLH